VPVAGGEFELVSVEAGAEGDDAAGEAGTDAGADADWLAAGAFWARAAGKAARIAAAIDAATIVVQGLEVLQRRAVG
jgi:hypothetical protein